jgi:hypothetical protein
MGPTFPEPRHMPCSDCGAAVERARRDEHVCDRERLLDYQMFQLRHEVAAMDRELSTYLASPHGRFAVWCAERGRANPGGPGVS